MRLKELRKDEMPRERLLHKGAETLTDTELLAILLRTGRGGANVIDVAREMLNAGGGHLCDLALMSTEMLCQINGVGPSKAVTIAAAFEIGRRAALEIRRFEPKFRVFGSAEHIQVRKDIFSVFFLLFFGQFCTYCLMYRLNRRNG